MVNGLHVLPSFLLHLPWRFFCLNLCVLVMGTPLMMAEITLGRCGRRNPAGTFKEAFVFLFDPDLSEIKTETILIAMGQAFFSLSIANGSIMMYGAYVPRNVSVISASIAITLADTSIALAAGLAIFPIVFANGLSPGAGPGLIFESLPIAFGNMPFGYTFGCLFFLMLVFAVFTSTISRLEPPVAWLVETFRIKRIKAACLMDLFIWLVGLATVLSFNEWSNIQLFGFKLF